MNDVDVDLNQLLAALTLIVLVKGLAAGIAAAVINFIDPGWWKS